MSGADTKNSHVRGKSRREATTVLADAERLVNDPAFQRGFDTVRDGLIRMLEDTKHDGQPETDAVEREVCRSLRTLKSLRRSISMASQNQTLKLATANTEADALE